MGCNSSKCAREDENGVPARFSRRRHGSDALNIGSPTCPAATVDMARMNLRPIQSANGTVVPIENIRHIEHPEEVRGAVDFLRLDETTNGTETTFADRKAINAASVNSNASISAQPPSDTSSIQERVRAPRPLSMVISGAPVNAKANDMDDDFAAVGPACNSSTAILHAMASGYGVRRADRSSSGQ